MEAEMESEKKTTDRDETMITVSITVRRKLYRAIQKLLIKQRKTFGTKPMTSRFFDEAAEAKFEAENPARERKRSG